MMYNPETGISDYPTIKEDFYVDLPEDDARHLVLLPGFDLNYFEVGKAYQITIDPGACVKKYDAILKVAKNDQLLFTYYDAGSLFEYKINIRDYVERKEVREIIKYSKR